MASYKALKFPLKLWNIVNECESGAIGWDTTGKIVLINYFEFKQEYLENDFGFKTTNIASFIRQLNLYGFRKLPACFSKEWGKNIHAYKNDNFIYGCRKLLENVTRKPSGVRRQQKNVGNSRLLFCQNALSKALDRARKRGSKRCTRIYVKEGLDEDIIQKANQLLKEPYEELVIKNEQDILEEYNSYFVNEFSVEVEDSIPIILPPEMEPQQQKPLLSVNSPQFHPFKEVYDAEVHCVEEPNVQENVDDEQPIELNEDDSTATSFFVISDDKFQEEIQGSSSNVIVERLPVYSVGDPYCMSTMMENSGLAMADEKTSSNLSFLSTVRLISQSIMEC